MARLIDKHLQKWLKDVEADIHALRTDLDELLGVHAWLHEQMGTEPPEDRHPEAHVEAPEALREPAPEPAEAPEPPAEGKAPTPGGRWGTWTRVSMEEVRDLVRNHGQVSVAEAANLLGCSDGNVRPKLQEWVEKGTLESEKITVDGRWMTVYRIKGIEHPPLRARRESSPGSLRLVGGVAGTGQRNPKVMKRRGKITGVKGQKGRRVT